MDKNAYVFFKKLSSDAQLPVRNTPEAAGMDLRACLVDPDGTKSHKVIQPGQICLVPTGLAMALLPGFEGQVRSRSGLAAKHGVVVLNAPGTIDSDYRGEIKVILINHGQEPVWIGHGDRIAQLVIAEVRLFDPIEVSELDQTDRGDKGFGSSGVK